MRRGSTTSDGRPSYLFECRTVAGPNRSWSLVAAGSAAQRSPATTAQTYTYGYNEVGARESLQYPGGPKTTYEYDSLNRLEQLTNFADSAGTDILSDYEYTLRADGRRIRAVEYRKEVASGYLFSTRTLDWDYDAIGRLTLERSRITGGHRPAQDQYAYDHKYFFDKSGNRTRKVALAFDAGGAQTGATTTQYVYFAGGKDRLAQELEYAAEMPYSATGGTLVAAYDYNANGFLIAKSVDIDSLGERKDYAFTPNAEDRLARASMAEGGSPAAAAAHFVYDVNGIRVQHWSEALSPTPAAATLARTYLVDSQNHTGYAQVLQERTPGAEGALQVARSYVIGDDVLSQVSGTGGAGDLQHLLYDGHGSTRLLYDTNAETPGLSQVYDYDAYGNAIGFDASDPGETLTNLLYCGEQFDQTQQIGMLYLRARWYDAGVGRFARADPLPGAPERSLALHRYAYCNWDPAGHTDPSGMFSLASISIAACLRPLGRALNFGRNVAVLGAISGLVGGVDSVLHGGTFSEGFLSGFQMGALIGAAILLSPAWVAYVLGGLFAGLFILGAKHDFENGNIWGGLFRLAVAGLTLGGVTARPTRGAAPIAEPSSDRVPFGFRGPDEFNEFGRLITEALEANGLSDATVAFRGSSVTGRSHTTGQAFDAGRTSDYDIAIASARLFGQARELPGMGRLRGGGTRTRVLNESQAEALGLRNLQMGLRALMGRDVSFMIYDSVESITARGDAIFLDP